MGCDVLHDLTGFVVVVPGHVTRRHRHWQRTLPEYWSEAASCQLRMLSSCLDHSVELQRSDSESKTAAQQYDHMMVMVVEEPHLGRTVVFSS